MGTRKFFKKVGRFFKRIAVGLFGKSALKKLGEAARKIFREAFGKIVMQIVTEIDPLNLSNAQKRRFAFGRIKNAAKNAGLESKDSLINLLIELAVARLKGVLPKQ